MVGCEHCRRQKARTEKIRQQSIGLQGPATTVLGYTEREKIIPQFETKFLTTIFIGALSFLSLPFLSLLPFPLPPFIPALAFHWSEAQWGSISN